MTDAPPPPDCVPMESGCGMWLPGQSDVLARSGTCFPYSFLSFIVGRETIHLKRDP